MLVLLAVVLAACAQVAEFIPGDKIEREQQDAVPDAQPTPILPRAGDALSGRGGLPTSAIPDHELARTVVQVRTLELDGGSPRVVRVGSGVIVDAEQRLILTAYPVVQPHRENGGRAYSVIGIAVSPDPGHEPDLAFEAEIAAADPRTQLAVLRIVRDYGGETLSESRFRGVAAFTSESASVSGGSPLRLFGHPAGLANAIGTQAVSMSSASVTGFRAEAGHTGRTWMKTDARLPHGLAGGPVFDQLGVLIGVLVQEQYLPSGEVAHARPLELAQPLIEEARAQTRSPGYRVPLMLTSTIPGTTQAMHQDGIWVSRPLFAEHALETATGRDLYEYSTRFPAGTGALYYEFSLSGVERGETVEERWYLDGVQQDSLSSEYVWDGGRFGFVTDRISAPGTSGLPSGRWRLEVWVGERLRARATALIGIEPRSPSVGNTAGGSTAGADRNPQGAATSGVQQVLAFFDFSGFEGVETFEWVVFRANQRIYHSPRLPWSYGDSGRTWVGFRDTSPIAAAMWEVEIYADGELLDVIPVEVR